MSRICAAAGLFALLAPDVILACATCFGAADEPAISGVKMAMLGLVGVTATIFVGIGVFTVRLARRSRALQTDPDPWRDAARQAAGHGNMSAE